jgi:hypothetical protein
MFKFKIYIVFINLTKNKYVRPTANDRRSQELIETVVVKWEGLSWYWLPLYRPPTKIQITSNR